MSLVKISPPEITESIIQDIVQRITKEFDPEKIVLFGSQARGKTREWSDIDILIVMDYEGTSASKAADISLKAKPSGIPVDFIVRSSKEITERLEMGDFFIRNIMDKGRVLYER